MNKRLFLIVIDISNGLLAFVQTHTVFNHARTVITFSVRLNLFRTFFTHHSRPTMKSFRDFFKKTARFKCEMKRKYKKPH